MASFIDFIASLGLLLTGIVAFLMVVDSNVDVAPSKRTEYLCALAFIMVSIVWVLARFWTI